MKKVVALDLITHVQILIFVVFCSWVFSYPSDKDLRFLPSIYIIFLLLFWIIKNEQESNNSTKQKLELYYKSPIRQILKIVTSTFVMLIALLFNSVLSLVNVLLLLALVMALFSVFLVIIYKEIPTNIDFWLLYKAPLIFRMSASFSVVSALIYVAILFWFRESAYLLFLVVFMIFLYLAGLILFTVGYFTKCSIVDYSETTDKSEKQV